MGVLLPHTAFRKLSSGSQAPRLGEGPCWGPGLQRAYPPPPPRPARPPRCLTLETSASTSQGSRQVRVGPPPSITWQGRPRRLHPTPRVGDRARPWWYPCHTSQGQDWHSQGYAEARCHRNSLNRMAFPWGSGRHADWLGQPLPVPAQWGVPLPGSCPCVPSAGKHRHVAPEGASQVPATWDRRAVLPGSSSAIATEPSLSCSLQSPHSARPPSREGQQLSSERSTRPPERTGEPAPAASPPASAHARPGSSKYLQRVPQILARR